MEAKENVVVLPKISDQHLLAKYYSMADAFVICSKRENFPTTCIEAQCCGTPIAGFDTGGTRETSLGEADCFVEYGNISALKERVKKLIVNQHNDLASKAEKAFSKEKMYQRYVQEYDSDGQKKRILLIDVNCKFSSTGKIVYDLFENLKKNGREAAVCYGRGKVINESGIYKFGLDWETSIHAFCARVTGYNGCFSPISTNRLIKYIDEFNPDIIHIHELHAYFVNIRSLIEHIKKKGIRVVWTFHCEYMYTGKCGHAYECEKFQTECHKCPAIHEYPKSLFMDKTREMYQMKKRVLSDLNMTIITPSQWLADRVATSFLKDRPIKVIHNGIDTTIFHPISAEELKEGLGIPQNYKIVLALAPNIMSESKGGQWILKLAETMKDDKVFFVLVGDTKFDI